MGPSLFKSVMKPRDQKVLKTTKPDHIGGTQQGLINRLLSSGIKAPTGKTWASLRDTYLQQQLPNWKNAQLSLSLTTPSDLYKPLQAVL